LLIGLASLSLGFALLLTGIAGYLTLSATAQAVASINAVSESQQRTVIQARRADDPAAQRAAAASTIGANVDLRAMQVTVDDVEQGGEQYLRWTLQPHATGFTAAAIPGLITGLEGLQRAFTADPEIAPSGVTTDGSLSTTLGDIQRRLGAEQGASLVPIGLVAIIGLVALGQVSRLQAAARAPQLGLIRSRGASFRRLALTAAVETLVVTLPAAALGSAAAIGLLQFFFAGVAVDALVLVIAVGVSLAAVGIVAVTTVATARTASLRDAAFSGRGRTAVGAVALVLVLVVAALSFWQFTIYGSPVVATPSGARVEPFLAAAPALVLLALVILGLTLFAPVAGIAEVSTARSRRVSPSFPIRQVSRRVGLHAVSVTVVALAVGSMVVGAAYSATLAPVSSLPAALRAGSDIRVISATEPSAPDATAIAPAIVTSGQFGGDAAELVALPAALLPEVMTDLDGTIEPATMGAAITAEPGGIPIDADTTELAFDVTITVGPVVEQEFIPENRPDETTGDATTQLRAIVADERDRVSVVPLEAIVGGGNFSRSIELPDGADRVLAVEVEIGPDALVQDYTITITAIDGTATEGNWSIAAMTPVESAFYGFDAPSLDDSRPASVRMPAYSYSQRVELVANGIDLAAPVPALINRDLADRLSLAVGDVITLRSALLGEGFDLEVSGIVAAVPGTTNAYAVLADLGRVEGRLLGVDRAPGADGGYAGSAVNQYWISSATPEQTAAGIAGDVTVVSRSTPPPSSTVIALWLGGLGALLLAAATLLAGNGMVSRARAGELHVLRALGMRRREIRAARRLEVTVVVVVGVVLGAASGLIVAALTVPQLARSATLGLPQSIAVPLALDPLALGAFGVATAAVLSIVAVIAGAGATAREVRE
jgi:hypothetical protein